MLRSIVSGLAGGTLVSAVIVVVAAQVLPSVDLALPVPQTGDVAVPAGSGFNAERPDTAPLLPSTEGRSGSSQAPEVNPPAGAEAPAVPAVDTSAVGTPLTGAAEGALGSPSTGVAPEVSVGADSGVDPASGAERPAQPGVDAAPDPTGPLDTPQAGGDSGSALAAPAAGAAPDVTAGAETGITTAGGVQAPVQPATEGAPTADTPATAPDASNRSTIISNPALPSDTPPRTVPDAPLGIGLAQPEIAELNPGIETDRLPRIGAEPDAPVDAIAEPALIRNAVPFETAGANPLVSLVLIDGPESPAPAQLGELPVPVSVALDPTVPGAALRMVEWRAAGVEVAVLTPLPAGATPADVEVSFQSFLSAIPQAVAVMDMPEARLQENRPRAAQVVEILADSGHGMITYDRGLNSGLQLAERRQVPAIIVFRVFDDGNTDIAAIKRFLDQGAFRASQVGPVVMVGQMRAEVVTAITEWALGTRAASVSLAPISAVLRGKN